MSSKYDKYEAAKALLKEKDASECSAALLQALKLGEASYEKSLRQQQNLTYGINVATSKGIVLVKDKTENILNRSKYLWSAKSVAYFDRLSLCSEKEDAIIGSSFEFMLKLQLILPENMNIGYTDTIFMVPDPKTSTGNESFGNEFNRLFSNYSFANQSFYLSKVCYVVSEIKIYTSLHLCECRINL